MSPTGKKGPPGKPVTSACPFSTPTLPPTCASFQTKHLSMLQERGEKEKDGPRE
jgi:hypothetical protein